MFFLTIGVTCYRVLFCNSVIVLVYICIQVCNFVTVYCMYFVILLYVIIKLLPEARRYYLHIHFFIALLHSL